MRFVIDTGTGISIIREQFFDTYLRGEVNIEPYIGQTYAANGQEMKVIGCSHIEITLGSTKKEIKFLVILEIGMEVIIGTQTLKDWENKINFEEKHILINGEELLMEIQRKGKQWAKVIYSTMLQPEQWVQVKIEVLKGKLNMIWKIETSC
jgi:hypothetical protein